MSMPKTIRSANFRTVFSNAIRMRLGDNDGSITFLIETDDETGAMIHEGQVQLLMTPKSLKILQMIVNHSIGELERVVRPIEFPPEKITEIGKLLSESKAALTTKK